MVAWVATAAGVILLLQGKMAGLLLLPLGPLIYFTYSVVELDLRGQTYRDGAMLLGMKFGRKKRLPDYGFLYLKKNTYRQVIWARVSTATFRHTVYDGYLGFANGIKLHLVRKPTKADALQRLEAISEDLHLELRDLTA